jgi:hypothetical protein
MPLTQTPLCCSNCDCQQLKTRKSYALKGGAVRQLYRCPECQHCFSETHDTPLSFLEDTAFSDRADFAGAQWGAGGQRGLPSVPREQKQPLSLARTFE